MPTPPTRTVITMATGENLDVTSGGVNDAAITLLFDAITGYDCNTYEDIITASVGVKPAAPFYDTAEVGHLLTLVRDPEVAKYYGWTVPHVPRGRPKSGQAYRYIVVGSGGSTLNPHDINIVQTGMISTGRLVHTTTERLAYALTLCASVTGDKKFKKWCNDTASVLGGVSTQSGLEAERMAAML